MKPNQKNNQRLAVRTVIKKIKPALCTAAAFMLLMSASRATLVSYYIGVDGQTTIPTGTYAGLPNPNHNRLTLLFAHTDTSAPSGNHYHSKSRLVYTGPNLGNSTAVTNLASNFVPESPRPPLDLFAGTGIYSGKLVSAPYPDNTNTNYPFSLLEIRAVDTINDFAPLTGENYLYNSSAGRWTGLLAGSHVHFELVSITPGLNVGSATSLSIGLTSPGDDIHLWEETDDLDAVAFTPVFWADSTATPGTYTASFKLSDDSGTFLDSGVYEYRFNVIPEPSALALLAGVGMLVLVRNFRRSTGSKAKN